MIEIEYNVSGISPLGFGVMFLKEKNNERYLAMIVLLTDAERLESKARGVSFPRPLTHDLIRNVIELLGAKISYAFITKPRTGDSICANLFLKVGNKEVPIDCRPSDAMLLCLNAQIPIYAEEGLLKEVSGGVANKEELKKLEEGPFGKLIFGLDLDDFASPKEDK